MQCFRRSDAAQIDGQLIVGERAEPAAFVVRRIPGYGGKSAKRQRRFPLISGQDVGVFDE
jgi:hypothetical protein